MIKEQKTEKFVEGGGCGNCPIITGFEKEKQELLHNRYKLWYNISTIIQRKDDEYEIYHIRKEH